MNVNTEKVVSEILATTPTDTISSARQDKKRTRVHTVGNLQLVITPRYQKHENHIKWRINCNVEGTLYFVNPEHETDKQLRRIYSMQSKDVRTLLRSIFPKAWEILYDYAVLLGNKDFQVTYLKHRIRIHSRWVDIHATKFAKDGNARSRQYVLHNATVEKKLRKRLDALLDA